MRYFLPITTFRAWPAFRELFTSRLFILFSFSALFYYVFDDFLGKSFMKFTKNIW